MRKYMVLCLTALVALTLLPTDSFAQRIVVRGRNNNVAISNGFGGTAGAAAGFSRSRAFVGGNAVSFSQRTRSFSTGFSHNVSFNRGFNNRFFVGGYGRTFFGGFSYSSAVYADPVVQYVYLPPPPPPTPVVEEFTTVDERGRVVTIRRFVR